jgi:urease accessory protein UreF
MFPHTAWTEGAQRVAHYQNEAAVHRTLAAAGLGSPTRRAVARLLHGTAEALVRTADRLVPSSAGGASHPVRRRPAANA